MLVVPKTSRQWCKALLAAPARLGWLLFVIAPFVWFILQAYIYFLILLPVLDAFFVGGPAAAAREIGYALTRRFYIFAITAISIPALTPAWYSLAIELRGWLKALFKVPRSKYLSRPVSREAGPAPDPHAVEHLLAVFPLLLPLLSPADRLSVWKASKTLALELWKADPAVQLSLTDSAWNTAAALMEWRGLGREMVLPRLLKAVRASFLPADMLPQLVQSLTLNNICLPTAQLRSLKAMLPNLQHLALVACQVAPDQRQSTGAGGGRRQAERLLCLSSFSCWDAEPTLAAALAPIDPRTLQSLTTDDPEIFSLLRTQKFPALGKLKLSGSSVNDAQLDALLAAMPVMQEVWLPALELRLDHSSRPCRWGVLRLQSDPMLLADGMSALTLAVLPLGGIARVVVERQLITKADGDAADLRSYGCVWTTAWPRLLKAAQRLEFEPGITGWGHLWAWSKTGACQVDLGLLDDEPGFTLLEHFSGAPPPEAVNVVALVARRMQRGTLVYSSFTCDLSDPAAALRPLQALSRSVHSVVLRNFSNVPRDPSALFAWLPLHVQRLVIKPPTTGAFVLHPKFIPRVYLRGQPAIDL